MREILSVGGAGYISKDKILGFGEAKGNSIAAIIKIKKEEGKVLDFRKGRTAKSIIYLEDGFIALSITTVDTLKNRFEEC